MTTLESVAEIPPSKAFGVSMAAAASELHAEQVESGAAHAKAEVESGGAEWSEVLRLYDLYCARILPTEACVKTGIATDGSGVSATGDSITDRPEFKRAAAFSEWIYHAKKHQRKIEEPTEVRKRADLLYSTATEEVTTEFRYDYPYADEFDCVNVALTGGKQIGQWALFVSKKSSSISSRVGYLTFRGTDKGKVFDLLADVCAIPFPIHGQQLGVHSGIYANLKRDYPRIQRLVTGLSLAKLYCCGHSLGGGLASCYVFESLLCAVLKPALSLITFGAPCVISLDLDARDTQSRTSVVSSAVDSAMDRMKHRMRAALDSTRVSSESEGKSESDSMAECSLVNGLSIDLLADGRMRAVLQAYATVAHHIVNRMDVVTRVPHSSPWIKGAIPYCLQQIVADTLARKLRLPMLASTLKEAMSGVLSSVRRHADLYSELLDTYAPLGTFYVFSKADTYYRCVDCNKVKQIFRFIPPIKIRNPDTGETVSVLMKCLDQREVDPCVLLSPDKEIRDKFREELDTLAFAQRQRFLRDRKLKAVYRTERLKLFDTDFVEEFVIVEDMEERVRSGLNKVKMVTSAWMTLAKCHSMGQYIKLFGVNMDKFVGAVSKTDVEQMIDTAVAKSQDGSGSQKRHSGGTSSRSRSLFHSVAGVGTQVFGIAAKRISTTGSALLRKSKTVPAEADTESEVISSTDAYRV